MCTATPASQPRKHPCLCCTPRPCCGAGSGVKGSDYAGGGKGASQLLNSPWDVALDRWGADRPGGRPSATNARRSIGMAAVGAAAYWRQSPYVFTLPYPTPPACVPGPPVPTRAARSGTCTSRWRGSTRSGSWTPPRALRVGGTGRKRQEGREGEARAGVELCQGGMPAAHPLLSIPLAHVPALHPPSPPPAATFSGSGYERNQNGTSGLTTAWAQPSGLALAPEGDAMFVAGGAGRGGQAQPWLRLGHRCGMAGILAGGLVRAAWSVRNFPVSLRHPPRPPCRRRRQRELHGAAPGPAQRRQPGAGGRGPHVLGQPVQVCA